MKVGAGLACISQQLAVLAQPRPSVHEIRHDPAKRVSGQYRSDSGTPIAVSSHRRAGTRSRRWWYAKMRLPSPGLLRAHAWQIACQFDTPLTIKIRPMHIRPRDTEVFRLILSGNVSAVRGALRSGELTVWDYRYGHRSLLDVFMHSICASSITDHPSSPQSLGAWSFVTYCSKKASIYARQRICNSHWRSWPHTHTPRNHEVINLAKFIACSSINILWTSALSRDSGCR